MARHNAYWRWRPTDRQVQNALVVADDKAALPLSCSMIGVADPSALRVARIPSTMDPDTLVFSEPVAAELRQRGMSRSGRCAPSRSRTVNCRRTRTDCVFTGGGDTAVQYNRTTDQTAVARAVAPSWRDDTVRGMKERTA